MGQIRDMSPLTGGQFYILMVTGSKKNIRSEKSKSPDDRHLAAWFKISLFFPTACMK